MIIGTNVAEVQKRSQLADMSTTKFSFGIWDGRYTSDPSSATCLAVCDKLKEARKEAHNYGDGNVIVRETLVSEDGGKTWISIESEVVA